MIEVKTRYGTVYVENAAEREEEDRIKIYDSRKRYFEYMPLSYRSKDMSAEEYVDAIVRDIPKLKNVKELIEYVGADYNTIGKIENLADASWVENDWINIIGDTYVLLNEY